MKRSIVVASLLFSSCIFAGGPTILEAPSSIPPNTGTNWTGFYFGANGGYAWKNVHTDFLPLPSASFGVNEATTNFNMTGGFVGGQIGYDWQLGEEEDYLFGLEADGEKSWIKGSSLQTAVGNGNSGFFPVGTNVSNAFSTNQRITWFGTFRPVFGILTEDNNWLLYITGGLSFGRQEMTGNTNLTSIIPNQFPASKTVTQIGWVGGAGIEWKFANHLSGGAQYLYCDLGTVKQTVNATPSSPPLQVQYTWHNPQNIVKMDLNYRFA